MTRMTQEQVDAHQARLKQSTRPHVVYEARKELAKMAINNALGRLPSGQMNNTEAAYAQLLAFRKHSGEITWWKFEAMKLRLADSTFYTPDFSVLLTNGTFEMHEIKGFWRDDARIKIKVAASLYPFRFIAVTKQRKKDGGGWSVEEF